MYSVSVPATRTKLASLSTDHRESYVIRASRAEVENMFVTIVYERRVDERSTLGQLSRYCVLTWDSDRQTFTPQVGVPAHVNTLGDLRRALRALRSCGYEVCRDDPSVLVYRIDQYELLPVVAGASS